MSVAVPTGEGVPGLERLLAKIVAGQGQTLADEELMHVCQRVFRPAIRRHYHWIRNALVRLGRAEPEQAAWAGSADEAEGELSDEDGSTTDPHPGDGPGDSGAGGGQRPHRNTYAWLADPVVQEAVSELWQRFGHTKASPTPGDLPGVDDDDVDSASEDDETEGEAPPQPLGPNAGREAGSDWGDGPVAVNTWSKAWREALRHEEAVRDRIALAYLRRCADRELTDWCGGPQSLEGQLRRRLAAALRCGSFACSGDRDHGDYVVFLKGVRPGAVGTDRDDTRLCAGVAFPPARGASSGYPWPLPTPSQIQRVLLQVFQTHGVALHVSQILSLLKHGWGLREPASEALPGDPRAEETGEEDNAAAETGHGPLGPNFRPAPRQPLPPEELARALVAAVEVDNGGPFDPALSPPGAGKLGRLFVEYFLWLGLPARGTDSGRYGIEKYAAMTGYAKTTENDRMNGELRFIIRRVFRKHGADLERDFPDALLLLRVMYLHRKPEFVDFAPFGRSEPEPPGQR